MVVNIWINPNNDKWSTIKYHALYGLTSTVTQKTRNRFKEYLHLNGWEF